MPGGIFSKVLDCRPRGPRFQPSRKQAFFSHQGALSPTPVIEKKGVLPSCLEEALSRWSQVTWFK